MAMIFRRYGSSYHSVDTNFDSLALNEVAFRRNGEESMAVDDLESGFETVATHDLVAEAEGDVQDHTEQVLLDRLEAKLSALREEAGDLGVVVVENEQGNDWPKTRQKTSNVIVEGENRLRFHYSVAPPLRVSVRRRRS
ncbi:MAG TPA: hypothetical protein VMM35_04500 [Longimicrobiales bacterium]|nr:hypothetical protein [Longimicrobiales bacterium]